MIISLIDLKNSTMKDPHLSQALLDLQMKARTMALVHEYIYQSPDLSQLDAQIYLENITQYLLQAYQSGLEIKTSVETGNIILDIDIAMPLGLVVNELVTNAVKYAFVNPTPEEEPCIRISLEVQEEGYLLRVSDNGIGLAPEINFKKFDTLGLRLVNLLIVHQLGGKIDIVRDRGTQFLIDIPFPKRRVGLNGA